MLSWLKSFFGTTKSQNPTFDKDEETNAALDMGNIRLLKKDFQGALAFYDIVIQNDMKKGYEQRAICLQALDYHIDAIYDFDKAIYFTPEDCNIYYMRAQSRIKIGDNEGAISDMNTAIVLSKEINETNRLYNDDAFQNGGRSLHDLYTANLPGIEAIAKTNELMRKLNQPSLFTSARRPNT